MSEYINYWLKEPPSELDFAEYEYDLEYYGETDNAKYEHLEYPDCDGPIDYKFREDELIEEFAEYIDQTYGGHYGQGGLQSSEVIVDRGHGIGFFLGNVDKYNGRYGKKGFPSDHRKDLMKIIHYGFLALYEHDRLNKTDDNEDFYNEVK